MTLKPLADRVVVKLMEAEEKTTGGIILTASAQEKPQVAEVIAVEGEADRAYLIERLTERIDTERFLLMLDDRAKQISLYKRHFNKVICE